MAGLVRRTKEFKSQCLTAPQYAVGGEVLASVANRPVEASVEVSQRLRFYWRRRLLLGR